MGEIAAKATVDRAREEVISALNELTHLLQFNSLTDFAALRALRWRIAMANKRMMVIQRQVMSSKRGPSSAIEAVQDVVRKGMAGYEDYVAHTARWQDEEQIAANWNEYRLESLAYMKERYPLMIEWFDKVYPALFDDGEHNVQSAA